MLSLSDYARELNMTAPADQDESERRLNDLLQFIRSHNDADTLARWFIEALATELHIPYATGDADDPTWTLRTMARALIESFAVARIEDKAYRREQVRIVGDALREVIELIRE